MADYRSASLRQAATLFVVITGSVLASLDLFVVNLAFGAIHHAFPGSTAAEMAWVVNAYGVAFAAGLIPAGRIADRTGRKRAFVVGMTVFAAASLACALAPTLGVLIAARAIQGIGAAAMIPTSLGLLLASSTPASRQRMVAIWAASGSVASALGPVLGGALVLIDWRWLFLVNVVVALPALLVARLVPSSESASGRIPDLLGSGLLAVTVGAVVAAITTSSESSAAATIAALIAVIGGIAFTIRQRRAELPAINFTPFQDRSFMAATIGMTVFYLGFGIMLLGGSLFLTQAWQMNTALAGAEFAAGPAAAVVTALVAGRWPLPPRVLSAAGGVLLSAGGLWWAVSLGASPNYWDDFLPGLILTGAGAGVAQTGFISGGTATLAAAEYGAGTGVLNTARQIGSGVGVAIFIAAAGTATVASHFQPAWFILAGAGLLAAVAGAILARHGQPAEAG
ncbi:MFS transporter [Curtobacterium flaccumfaciens]|uniref:MFS transporter n=1 Tax=Curtobacterium flaccumfaciens TaxID=2035 RepID=UPI0039959D68